MRHRFRSRALCALAAASLLASPLSARAAWPFGPDVTREQAADRSNWPNDPDYPRQYHHWSWIPAANQALMGFRTPELAIGAGNNTDRAWGLTLGDPRVLIAVLDSGIQWDERNIQLQAALNLAETPRPQRADGSEFATHDADGNGRIDVRDYANDPRITCGTALPHPIGACRDAMGQPNDANRNGILDAGDLIRTFSNGMDEDGNGFVDDISGWDFFKDDNDPYDDTRYGHGTGEAEDSTASGNDGIGSIGGCSQCQFVPMRVGDSFVTDSNDFAQAVMYASDADYGQSRRVRVIQEALGSLNLTRFAQQAMDYAYRRGLIVVASAADENSRHHNLPGTGNHTLYVHAVRGNRGLEASTTFLAFNNCTNYGGQLMLSVAGNACSSEAVGQSSGIAGLIYSYALQRNLTPELSAEEVRQLFITTVDDINVPESQMSAANYNSQYYPSLPGWDQRFGYGRVNARNALEAIRDGKIPPEVDVTSPRWFQVHYPDRAPMLRVEGHINARRATNFDYVVEWAPGIEPMDSQWRSVAMRSNVNAAVDGELATIDTSSLMIDNAGERENRYTITLRVRAVAHYGGATGDVRGEYRKVVYIHRDSTLVQGFPVDLHGSGEASPRIADLDGDGRGEVVVVNSDGVLHAFKADGTEATGFPVRTNLIRGYDGTTMVGGRIVDYRNMVGHRMGTEGRVDFDGARDMVLSAPAIANIDDEPNVEIVLLGYGGNIYVFNHDGTAYGHGFPRTLDDVPSSDTSPTRILDRGIAGAPVIVDLDRNGRPEIVFGAFDGKLYALDTLTAADHPGFPVLLHYTREPNTEYNRAFGSVGVADIDGDMSPDIVAVSNERIANTGDNTGPIYAVYADGNRHAGGPFHPGWPIPFGGVDILPLVGSGIMNAPALGDVDGDGRDELGAIGNANLEMLVLRGDQRMSNPREQSSLARVSALDAIAYGARSDDRMRAPFVPAFSFPTFADLKNNGRLAMIASGANARLLNAASGGIAGTFNHLVGAWDAQEGTTLAGFPKVLEDYTFFVNPISADVSGDAYPEVMLGTGGYYLHAVDACGVQAPGFPKFTGQWLVGSPALGDLDGDGTLEIVATTRSGWLYAWRTMGRTTGNVQWPTFRHDNSNTGNWRTPLPFGTRRVMEAGPIVCAPRTGDAGASDAAVDPDASMGDASLDGSTMDGAVADGGRLVAGGGCGCRTAAKSDPSSNTTALAVGSLGLALAALSRRRRSARS
ncbi:MAG: S8 family serine peptidase [Polyangiales bacterium]